MAYQDITCYDSPNYTPGRGGTQVNVIVIHWWNSPDRNPGFEGAIRTLCNPAVGTSAHCVAEAGRVAWIVNAADTAWHAGDYSVNKRSIGIECNPRMSSADLETIAELIANIRRDYGWRIPWPSITISTILPAPARMRASSPGWTHAPKTSAEGPLPA